MPSLRAEYDKERRGVETIETPYGFATYSFPDPDTIYLEDLYVKPEVRRQGAASKLADQVAAIGRMMGAKHMLGSVDLSVGGVTVSMKALLGYGMEYHSVSLPGIYFRKAL